LFSFSPGIGEWVILCYTEEVITGHFFKTVALFSAMIALGLLGAFLANRYGIEEKTAAGVIEVAK